MNETVNRALTDAEIIYGIEVVCFDDNWTLKMVRDQLENDDTVYFFVFDGDKAVGFVLGCLSVDEAELYRIAVLPEYRRKGYSDRLMKMFAAKCTQSVGKIFLEVRSKNQPAVSLYKKHGYERIAVRKGYYNDDDAEIYQLTLNE